jgi:hypothetical protein
MDELLTLGLLAVFFGVWLFAVIDAMRMPAAAWHRVGRPKAVWVLFMLFCGQAVAGAYYLAVIRRQMRRA